MNVGTGENMDVYLNDWAGEGAREAMIRDFEIQESDLDGAEILLASYTYECYSGSAFVLFRRDGKLYEVNGSHCSCYGLEGQWEPEETSVEALRKRDGYYLEEIKPGLYAALDLLEARHEV